jgi:hypothetical protein
LVNARIDIGQEYYDKQYRSATKIDIVGLTCRGFCKALRRSRNENTLLGELSVRNIHVRVLFVDPLSDYAPVRTREDNDVSGRLTDDLWTSITDVYELWREESGYQRQRFITGSLEIRLLSKNPYVSLFRSVHQNDRQNDGILLGLLLDGERGDAGPQFQADKDGLNSFFHSVDGHYTNLWNASRLLLRWDHRSLDFQEPYDAVCSYSHNACATTKAIYRAAQAHLPHLSLWLDSKSMGPGVSWYKSFSDAVKRIRRVFVIIDDTLHDGQRTELSKLRGDNELLVVPLYLQDPKTRPQGWPEDFWYWLRELRHEVIHFDDEAEVTPQTIQRLRTLLQSSATGSS